MDRTGKDVKSATGQDARFRKAARQIGCDTDRMPTEAELKAILTSQTATDAQVLDALDVGLRQGEVYKARSRAALRDSRQVLARAEQLRK